MATHHNFRIKNGLEVGGVLIVNSSGQLQATTISGAISATSIGVTNIVTNKVVKFNGTILDDSNITDTGSLITLGSNTAVTGKIQLNDGADIQWAGGYGSNKPLIAANSNVLNFYTHGASGGVEFALTGSAVDFKNNPATNVGTISSGAITSTGNSEFDGEVQIGDTVSQNAYGLLQVNQEANNDESGIGILSSSAGRSMRLWVDETSSYINSGNGGSGQLILNQAITVSSSGNLTGVGNIRTTDGTNTSVSYGFTGDTNTGMYSPANHELGFTTNGGQRLKLNSAGADITGTLLTDNSVKVTGTALSNNTPATDQVELSGYGMIGNRGNLYITNSNASGIIQMGISGAHNANPKLTVTTSGITVGGTVSATGGNSTNWNTAYTYSQVGHLPLAGGTMTGNINMDGNELNNVELIKFKNKELTDFSGSMQMILDANDSDTNVPGHGDHASSYPMGIYFTGDNDESTTTLGSGLVKVWHTGHFNKAHIDYFVGLYDSGVTTTEYDYLDGVTSAIQTQLNSKLTSSSLSGYATETYVGTQIDNLIDGAPGTLNTLNELAAAVDDNNTFFSTVLPKSGGTMTGTLALNAADSLSFESGKHWITYNDGEGNFNIRVGHKSDGTPNEVATETGYVFHDEWSQSSGWREFNISATSITDGADVGAWRRQMYYDSDAVYLAYQGSNKLNTSSAGISVNGTVTATGGNSTNWNTAHGWGNHASAGYLTSHQSLTSLLPKSGGTMTGNLILDDAKFYQYIGANSAPQSTDYLYIGGDGLASSNAAIYIGNGGGGAGYGYRIFYNGAGSGNLNRLILKSENVGTNVDMLSFTADGVATFVPGEIRLVDNASNQPKIRFSENTTNMDADDAEVILEYNGAGAGDGNYIGFYSDISGWVTKGNGLNYIPSNGHVAIGRSDPTNKFHVVGNARVEGNLMAGGASATNVPARPIHVKSSGDAAAIRIEDTTSSNLVYDMRVTHGQGLLFINDTAGNTPLTITDDGHIITIGNVTNPLNKNVYNGYAYSRNTGHTDQTDFFAISDFDDDISLRRKFERGDGDSNFNKEDDADAPASGVFSVNGPQSFTWGPYIPLDDNSEWIFETWIKHDTGSDTTGNFYAGSQWYNGSKTSLGNNSRYWGANGDVHDADHTTWRFIRGVMRGGKIRAQSATATAKYGRHLTLFNYNTTGNKTLFCGFRFYKAKQTITSLSMRQSINSGSGYSQDSAWQSTEAATSLLVIGHDQRIYGNGGDTNTTPQFSFNSDTDTGLAKVGTNAVGLVAAGSRKFYVNGTNAYFQNLTGGVTMEDLFITSEYAAYVNTARYQKYRSSYGGASTADFEIKCDNNTVPVAKITSTGTADILQVYDGTVETFSIEDGGTFNFRSNGDLQLNLFGDLANSSGEATDAKLSFFQDGTAHDMLHIGGNNNGDSPNYSGLLGNSAYIITGAGHGNSVPLQIGTAGTARMIVASDGKVGIGLTNPGKKLEVSVGSSNTDGIRITGSSANTSLIINNTGSNGVAWDISSTGAGHGYGVGALHFGVGFGTPKMKITSAGNVGIGTNTPEQKLHVEGKALIGEFSPYETEFPSNTASLHIHEIVNDGSGVDLGNEAHVVISTGVNATGAQGYQGSLWFGTSDHPAGGTAVGGGTQFVWRNAGIASTSGTGDTGANSAVGNLEFYTNNGSSGGTNRMTIGADGKVGIGTTAQSYQLRVGGDTQLVGNGSKLYFDTLSAGASNYIGTINDYETVIANGRGSAAFAVIGNSNIRLGFGTNYTDAQTDVSIASNGNVNFRSEVSVNGQFTLGTSSTPVGNLLLYGTGNNYLKFYGTAGNDFLIDLEGTSATGNLKIQQFNFQVKDGLSHFYKSGGTSGTQQIVAVVGSDTLRPVLQFSESSATAISAGMSLEYNGVGSGDTNFMAINDVNGAHKFKVYSGGSTHFKSDSFHELRSITNDSNTCGFNFTDNSDGLQVGTFRYVHANGRAYGGGAAFIFASSETLNVVSEGNFVATGNITAYYSDERLKDFHGKIENAIDKVSQLNGYYFTENEKAKDLGYNNDKVQLGLNAQEVERVLPEAVDIAPISYSEGVDEEYLTVDYSKLVPVLIEGMKEQQSIINRLELEINDLKNKIK